MNKKCYIELGIEILKPKWSSRKISINKFIEVISKEHFKSKEIKIYEKENSTNSI